MVVSKPRPKDHLALRILLRQPQSVHRRVNDADIGAAGFRLQKRAVFTRHAHGVAEGAEDHSRAAGNLNAGVDAPHRQDAHRAAGTMNKFDVLR